MVEVLVLYYTRTGKTRALADSVAEGVESVEGASVALKRVDFATVNDLLSCNAVAFGSPNYFSYMAGEMKSFFDKGLGIRGKTEGKPAAAYTSGGGDSDTALASLERMIGSYKLEKAADGIIQTGDLTDEVLAKCKAMGKALTEAAAKRSTEPTE